MAFNHLVTACDKNKKLLGKKSIVCPETFEEAKKWAAGEILTPTAEKKVDAHERAIVEGYMRSEIILIQAELRNANADSAKPKKGSMAASRARRS